MLNQIDKNLIYKKLLLKESLKVVRELKLKNLNRHEKS